MSEIKSFGGFPIYKAQKQVICNGIGAWDLGFQI
jgi:hypothetical protein